MKILLDDNFPLALYRRLTADGEAVEHIITLGGRGASVVVSRVRQARRLAERVDIWRTAILSLTQNPRPERRFELIDDGTLVAWEQRSPGVWTASPPSPEDPQR